MKIQGINLNVAASSTKSQAVAGSIVDVEFPNSPDDLVNKSKEDVQSLLGKQSNLSAKVSLSNFDGLSYSDALGKFSAVYSGNGPKIMFVSEYIVNNEFKGVLVCWKKYSSSTHYAVWKKNFFSVDKTDFERVIVLSVQDLANETKNFIPYLVNNMGMTSLPDDLIVVLDTNVKKDRVYSYKIKASRVPASPKEVDYHHSLKQHPFAYAQLPIASSTQNIFDFSRVYFGDKSLAWVLCLLNNKLRYFGEDRYKPIKELVKDGKILVPSQMVYLSKALFESFAIFADEDVVVDLIDKCGGMNEEFVQIIKDSFDDNSETFDKEYFKNTLTNRFPYLADVQSKLEPLIKEISDSLSVVAGDSLSDKLYGALSDVVEAASVLEAKTDIKEDKLVIRSLSDLSTLMNYLSAYMNAIVLYQDNNLTDKLIQSVDATKATIQWGTFKLKDGTTVNGYMKGGVLYNESGRPVSVTLIQENSFVEN